MPGRVQRELALLLTGKDISASRAVKGVSGSLNDLHRAGAKAGSSVARNITRGVELGAIAATGAVGFAVKQAMDFESSTASIAKTVEGNIEGIVAANRELAKTTGMEINMLNEISATAGALGVATDDVDDFTRSIAILGVTTDDVTTDFGAAAIGHLSTTLRLAGDDFDHLSNTLVYLGNNGASTEGQILSMTENIAGAAATMDASTEQVLGWAAAVANTGEEAEAGGSSIQRFWLGAFKHVQAGGKGLRLFAKVSGKTVAQFKKDFGRDATGALADFIVELGKLPKGEQLNVLEDLGFSDIRITRALLKLTANTDNLTDSLALAEEGWKENNAATTEAQKRFDTTASKLAILKANVNDAAITIGSELLPVLADLSEDAVGWISEHQGDIRAFSQDLAEGIRDAVAWAQKLDWEAIGGGLHTAATAGGLLIEAFTNAPPWLQGFLTTGFLANKFTGGAVMDVAAILLGQAVRGVLGMNAGVVNIRAGVVNGGGGLPGTGGPGGRGGGGGGGGRVGGLIKGALGVTVVGLTANAALDIAGATRDSPNRRINAQGNIVRVDTSQEKRLREINTSVIRNGFVVTNQVRAAAMAEHRRGERLILSGAAQKRAIAESGTRMSRQLADTKRETTRGLTSVRTAANVASSRQINAAAQIRAAERATAAAVRAKKLSVNTNVTVNSRVSVSARTLAANQAFISSAVRHL